METLEVRFQECLNKAKKIVTSYRDYYSPTCIIIDEPMNGGSAPAAQDESAVMYQYQQYLPAILNEISAAIPGIAQQEATGAAEAQPVYNASNLQQLQEYAMPETQIANEVANSQALAGASTNLEQLQGAGGQAAATAQGLNEALNPNYYGDIGAASQGAQSAIGAIDLTGLSPGEEAAVDRANNQALTSTGNLGLNNGTNIISNAMNFGGAFNNKLGLMENAAGTAANVAGAASGNAGFNPVSVALGQPNVSGSNMGTGTFNTINPTSTSTASGMATSGSGSLLGQMGQQNTAATTGAYNEAIANNPTNYIPNVSC